MTRLIDADELKQAEIRISSLPWGDWRGNKVKFTWMPHEVQRLIDKSPTIDAVEVVRCRDCRFSETYQNDSSGSMSRYCKAFTFERMVADDDYCSYGERKDGEKLVGK